MIKNDASPRGQEQEAESRRPQSENRGHSEQAQHFARIRETVKKAITSRHTFMICGRARIIRECLLNRGWCEKLQRKSGQPLVGDQQQMNADSNPTILMAGVGDLCEIQNERLLISKMLTNHTVDFLWNSGSEWSCWPSQENKSTIFNRFIKANFTSKVGLCSNVRQMHWYYEAGIANTLFPRCYNITQPEQMHAFIEDFRLTACLTLLKWLVDKVKSNGEDSVKSACGTVPLRALDFAIGRCCDFLGSKSHEDIDQELEKVWTHQWEQFVGWYYKLIHNHALFISTNVPISKYFLAARHLIKKAKKYWPQLEMDGTMNIWILKPGNKSRGRGIILMNKLEDIIAKVTPSNKTTDTRFVVQKYIERPLLIYDTKFDIRQWFIITNAQPLTLWMYRYRKIWKNYYSTPNALVGSYTEFFRESYLRFCSQKFSLTDFHESIHLTNNAVQCKYKNSPDRDSGLPNENMWDVATFKDYLKLQGDGDVWDELIYPGIKQGLVGSLLASQDAMDRRKNSFELYGADFMVMEDFSVWLIEINNHPDMSNSTSVTTRLCRKAMEDTVKVVIDYRENQNADTGDFELVYKQKLSPCQAYLGSGLSLHGTRITVGEKRSSINTAIASVSLNKRKPILPGFPTLSSQSPNRVGPVLVDLIEELELQLEHEFFEYLKLRSASGLSRQVLPVDLAPCDTNNEADRDFIDFVDSETNTITKGINISSSQTTLKPPIAQSTINTQKNVAGKLSKSSLKNLPISKYTKLKANTYQDKNSELSVPPPMPIMDIQKEAIKMKTSSTKKTGKLHRIGRISENFVLNNGSLETGEMSTMKDKKIDRKTQRILNANINPSISGTVLSPQKEKDVKTSRLTIERIKTNHLKKRNYAINNKIFDDVTDIYAVGLAVNK